MNRAEIPMSILLQNFYEFIVIDMLKLNNYTASRHISWTKTISISKDSEKQNDIKYCDSLACLSKSICRCTICSEYLCYDHIRTHPHAMINFEITKQVYVQFSVLLAISIIIHIFLNDLHKPSPIIVKPIDIKDMLHWEQLQPSIDQTKCQNTMIFYITKSEPP